MLIFKKESSKKFQFHPGIALNILIDLVYIPIIYVLYRYIEKYKSTKKYRKNIKYIYMICAIYNIYMIYYVLYTWAMKISWQEKEDSDN